MSESLWPRVFCLSELGAHSINSYFELEFYKRMLLKVIKFTFKFWFIRCLYTPEANLSALCKEVHMYVCR
jgi:hypothetical protein